MTSKEWVGVTHWQDLDYLANVIPLYGQTLFEGLFFIPLLVGIKIVIPSGLSYKQVTN